MFYNLGQLNIIKCFHHWLVKNVIKIFYKTCEAHNVLLIYTPYLCMGCYKLLFEEMHNLKSESIIMTPRFLVVGV